MKPSSALEKRVRLRRCDVSSLLAAPVALARQIGHVLLRVLQQVVESVRLPRAVRPSKAPAHQTLEVLRMLGVEEREQIDDRAPCGRTPRL